MKCYELAKISSFYTFTVVAPDRVDIGEWYGYDIRRTYSLTRAKARDLWRRLVNEGYTRERMDMNVNTIFAGYHGEVDPKDLEAVREQKQ